jgi:hypothetical protein
MDVVARKNDDCGVESSMRENLKVDPILKGPGTLPQLDSHTHLHQNHE